RLRDESGPTEPVKKPPTGPNPAEFGGRLSCGRAQGPRARRVVGSRSHGRSRDTGSLFLWGECSMAKKKAKKKAGKKKTAKKATKKKAAKKAGKKAGAKKAGKK